MRPLMLVLSFLSLGSLRVCGVGEDAPPPVAVVATVTASPPTTIPVMGAPPGRRGGTVIVAGTHQVEVLPKADGEIVAYVAGPGGSVPAPSQVNLTVTVQGIDAQPHPVVLAWDSEELRYEGRLVGTTPAPGPAQVTLVVSGAPVVATAPMIVIVPATVLVQGEAPHGRVEVRANGDTALDGPEGHVEVDGNGGLVNIQGPHGGVLVGGPDVYVDVPGPEGRVEVRGAEGRGGLRVVAPGLFLQPPSGRIDVRLGGSVEVDGRGDERGRGRGRRH